MSCAQVSSSHGTTLWLVTITFNIIFTPFSHLIIMMYVPLATSQRWVDTALFGVILESLFWKNQGRCGLLISGVYMRDEESNKNPVPSISFPHVHHGLLKGRATLAHQTRKGMSSGKLPAICMSLVPQQQRMLSLWVLKGLITFSLSGKKLDLLQCSCIFCSWMICLSYKTISLYHSGILETVLHRSRWGSLSDQRPLGVLVFAFLPFISGFLRGLCENRTESSGESIQGLCCQLCSRALLLPVLQYSLIPG